MMNLSLPQLGAKETLSCLQQDLDVDFQDHSFSKCANWICITVFYKLSNHMYSVQTVKHNIPNISLCIKFLSGVEFSD